MTFTVVTPSFGQLDWLEFCLASVADQRGVEFVEHIVCDGGSPGIEKFRENMLQRFPASPQYKLDFVIGPDAGMYDAINKGLRRSSCGVCSYLNCDEQLLPGALQQVDRRLAVDPQVDVLFGDTVVVNGNGEALCYWRPYVPSLAHLGVATLNTLSCSTFFRKKIVDRGHLFDPSLKVAGDMMWVRDLLRAGYRMTCLHQPLAVFTWLGENLGLSVTAREEFAATRQSCSSWQRVLLRLRHGLRKLLSGVYVRRNFDYRIFSLRSPSERQTFVASRLGWAWPSSPLRVPSENVD